MSGDWNLLNNDTLASFNRKLNLKFHIHKVIYLLPTLMMLMMGPGIMAQITGSIKGIVYDKKTREPVIFTNVALEGTKYGMATDINGYYALTKVEPGSYTLVVSSVGYEKYSKAVTLDKGDILTRNIYLQPATIKLDAVQISAEKQEARTT